MQVMLSGGSLSSLPELDQVARLVHRDATWWHGALKLIVGVHPGAEIGIASPTEPEVLAAVTSAAPAEITTSDKGYLAAALERSRDCSPLTRVDALKAIADLTTPRSNQLLRALRTAEPGSHEQKLVEIALEWGGRTERRSRSAQELGRANRLTEVLETLADGDWAERGIRMKCDACLMTSFLTLSSVGTSMSCPGCGSGGRAQGTNGPTVMYRLNSLVDRCSDQGALPHVAAAQALTALGHSSDLILGADIAWHSGGHSEVDIFGFLGREVIAGEVKTSSSEFTREQLDRDIELSRRLGARRHIMASMQALSDATIDFAAEGARQASMNLSVIAPFDAQTLTVRAIN
jgi:hypothetical protein